jgi:tryptophan synthase alpha chain
VNALERHLRVRRDAGRALLVPYLTGGVTPDWPDYLRAYADAGADAVEVGLPFSDPTLDGPTIQRACDAALARGTTVRGVPLVASTYANLVVHHGPDAFCGMLRDAGVDGLIVADVPLEESGALSAAAAAAGVDLVLLAAPSTPPDRLAAIVRYSRGFVYAVSLLGTTGERDRLDGSAGRLAARLKGLTDRPVLLGFGISTPEQAALAARDADGVVVGAALMRRVLDGAGPADTGRYLAGLRRALDDPNDDPVDEGRNG